MKILQLGLFAALTTRRRLHVMDCIHAWIVQKAKMAWVYRLLVAVITVKLQYVSLATEYQSGSCYRRSTMADLAEGIKRANAVRCWSDLHPDLAAEIFRRLDVADYIRCLSVCASWRSVPEETMEHCKPKRGRQLPWLLASDEPHCMYGTRGFDTKMAELHLPQIAHHRCIGSSQGFLIAVDGAELGALNPLTGARFPVPPAATLPDILIYFEFHPEEPPRLVVPDDSTQVTRWYRKAVVSPPLDAVAVATVARVTSEEEEGITRHVCGLAFARAGEDSWTALTPPSSWIHWNYAEDFVFHNGLLYAVYFNGYLAVFDLENPSAPPLVSPTMVRIGRGLSLTETPDGESLLLLRLNLLMGVSVFMLDQTTLEWNQAQSIGDVALFLCSVSLSSLSAREFPCLRSNCIYFTPRANWPNDAVNRRIGVGVYDLEDGSIHPWSPGGELCRAQSLLWFTPSL